MIDYSEKRDFIRMPVSCEVTLSDNDGAEMTTAELRDLSATGVRFISRQALDTGARLQITVAPDNPITPPLQAQIAVVRCQPCDNSFDIAASIETMAPVTYPD